jgi:hypothetical protein
VDFQTGSLADCWLYARQGCNLVGQVDNQPHASPTLLLVDWGEYPAMFSPLLPPRVSTNAGSKAGGRLQGLAPHSPGRPRIEYICPYGHGTLKEDELQICGSEAPQWTRNSRGLWEDLRASARESERQP